MIYVIWVVSTRLELQWLILPPSVAVTTTMETLLVLFGILVMFIYFLKLMKCLRYFLLTKWYGVPNSFFVSMGEWAGKWWHFILGRGILPKIYTKLRSVLWHLLCWCITLRISYLVVCLVDREILCSIMKSSGLVLWVTLDIVSNSVPWGPKRYRPEMVQSSTWSGIWPQW